MLALWPQSRAQPPPWRSPAPAARLQVDVRSGALMSWRREGHFPGEPIFVARPGAVEEDDGVLLSVVLEGEWGGAGGGAVLLLVVVAVV